MVSAWLQSGAGFCPSTVGGLDWLGFGFEPLPIPCWEMRFTTPEPPSHQSKPPILGFLNRNRLVSFAWCPLLLSCKCQPKGVWVRAGDGACCAGPVFAYLRDCVSAWVCGRVPVVAVGNATRDFALRFKEKPKGRESNERRPGVPLDNGMHKPHPSSPYGG